MGWRRPFADGRINPDREGGGGPNGSTGLLKMFATKKSRDGQTSGKHLRSISGHFVVVLTLRNYGRRPGKRCPLARADRGESRGRRTPGSLTRKGWPREDAARATLALTKFDEAASFRINRVNIYKTCDASSNFHPVCAVVSFYFIFCHVRRFFFLGGKRKWEHEKKKRVRPPFNTYRFGPKRVQMLFLLTIISDI